MIKFLTKSYASHVLAHVSFYSDEKCRAFIVKHCLAQHYLVRIYHKVNLFKTLCNSLETVFLIQSAVKPNMTKHWLAFLSALPRVVCDMFEM